jgi:hypothetical protein
MTHPCGGRTARNGRRVEDEDTQTVARECIGARRTDDPRPDDDRVVVLR